MSFKFYLQTKQFSQCKGEVKTDYLKTNAFSSKNILLIEIKSLEILSMNTLKTDYYSKNNLKKQSFKGKNKTILLSNPIA